MRKVLVLGGSGLVGSSVVNELGKDNGFQVYATYFQNPLPNRRDGCFKLDVQDCSCINAILDNLNPEIVISCLRGDYGKQLELHTAAARFLKDNGGSLYYCSTANVFDNDLSRPHFEDDTPVSCTDYGRFKIECEKKIIETLNENACICRLPQMWGRHSKRMTSLLDTLVEGKKIEVYPKLLYNTNTDIMLAKQIHYILLHNLNGIFHLAADDIINHNDFYSRLAAGLGYDNVDVQENMDEQGCFALLSSRGSEFPQDLRITNGSVIKYLNDASL